MVLLVKLVDLFLSMLGMKLANFALTNLEKATFESLGNNLKALCSRASDIDWDIKQAEMCGEKKRKREIDDWFGQVQTIENCLRILVYARPTEGFVRQFLVGNLATKLDAIVTELLEQSSLFGELARNVDNTKGDMLLAKELIGEEFKKNLENISRFLLVDKVSSIGIYGMGGVGKTTLAKHINNRLLEQTQEHVVWITVSKEFTIARLQIEIAKFLGINLPDESSEDMKASMLNKMLVQRKNFVFIFDDVWKNIDLEKLGDPLSVDGCRVLITTWSDVVCHQLGCQKVIKVETLKEKEAWFLFKETLGQDMYLSTPVQNIAESMVKLCEGLPLEIITLGGIMRGETSIHVWSDACAEMRKSVMELEHMKENVLGVLRYSFDPLNQYQEKSTEYSKWQKCLRYCCVYPEEEGINRDELIKKFIEENFLDKRESRKALFSQDAILDKLVRVCLLARVDDHVKMHDMVRALAQEITKGQNKEIARRGDSLKEVQTKEWNKDFEKTPLINNLITTISDAMYSNYPNMSTLLLDSNDFEHILYSNSLNFCGLCVLNLSGANVKKLSDSLSELRSLKALLLPKCQKLVSVPCLGKLEKLRELDFTLTAIEEVPKGMDELIHLKFLLLGKTYQLEMLPRGLLLKFPDLQCLHLPHHVHVSGEEVAGLKHLEEFRGRVKDARNFFILIRSKKSLAYSIEVCSDFQRYRLDEFRGYNQLILSRFDFKKAKDEDMAAMLTQGAIRHLKLHACEGHNSCLVEDLSRMICPSILESLEVHRCEKIECLLRREQILGPEGKADSTPISPPPGQAVFQSLKQLDIFYCNKIKRLGLLVSELSNLEKMTIAYCEELEDIMKVDEVNGRGELENMEKGAETEHDMEVDKADSAREEATKGSVVSLPKLKCLFLECLPRLKSFCNAKVVCNSIETISLWGCPTLKELPLVFEESNCDSPQSALKSILKTTDESKWDRELEMEPP